MLRKFRDDNTVGGFERTMLFNSLSFVIFFGIVYAVYRVASHAWQNRLLLAASYIFYGLWDWRFMFLLFFLTAANFWCGKKIYGSTGKKKRQLYLGMSLGITLLALAYFKYANFFVFSLQKILTALGISMYSPVISIVLPLGLSFYTFQIMSYTLDIYRGTSCPTKSFLNFALFVSFFPQLLSGPIERASHLLPQIEKKRVVSSKQLKEGLFLIFWGLYQKMFIAANLGQLVDLYFSSSLPRSTLSVIFIGYAFTIQIFCDFAGYSNIARGLGKLMGFDIVINFNAPFFARSIQEYWTRWHISLTSWFRDYVYITVFQGLRFLKGMARVFMTILCTMIIIGIWHGATLPFVIFGVYHGTILGCYFIIRPVLRAYCVPSQRWKQRVWQIICVASTFHIVVLGMLIFRAESLARLCELRTILFSNVFNINIACIGIIAAHLLIFIPLLMYVLFWQYRKNYACVVITWNKKVQYCVYCIMVLSLFLLGTGSGEEFIYFQF